MGWKGLDRIDMSWEGLDRKAMSWKGLDRKEISREGLVGKRWVEKDWVGKRLGRKEINSGLFNGLGSGRRCLEQHAVYVYDPLGKLVKAGRAGASCPGGGGAGPIYLRPRGSKAISRPVGFFITGTSWPTYRLALRIHCEQEAAEKDALDFITTGFDRQEN